MERESSSEYQRSYHAFEFNSALRIATDGIAGLSSMDMAISREPAFQGKGRSPDRRATAPLHTSTTVNALIEPANEVGKSNSDVKRLKMEQFNKMRQLNDPLKLPLSEYNLQFGWKPQEGPSPMLGADGRLRHQDSQRQEDQRKVVIRADEDAQPEQNKPLGDLQFQPVTTREGDTLAAGGRRQLNRDGMEQHPGHHHRRKHHRHHSKGSKKHAKKGLWCSVPLSTEYRQQFKVWPLSTSPDRSFKNMKGSSPASLPAAGAPPRLHSPSDPRLQRHSPIKTNLPKPANVPKSTEYATNFNAPSNCKYVKGAWLQSDQDPVISDPQSKDGESCWLAQVQELKQKCHEYKERSQGTFFSRDYLDRLEKQQLSLLETASSRLSCASSDVCSTCGDSATAASEDVRVHDVEDDFKHTAEDGDGRPSHRVGVSTANAHTRTQVRSPPLHRKQPESSLPLSHGMQVEHGTSQFVDRGKLLNKSRSTKGNAVRPPTPELKGGEQQWGSRHHLNRTTPYSGSLVSPEKAQQQWQRQPNIAFKAHSVSPRYRRDMTSRAPIFPADTGHSRLYGGSGGEDDGDDDGGGGGESVGRNRNHRLGQTHTVSRPKTSKHQPATAFLLPGCGNDSSNGLECSVCGAELDDPNSSQLKAHQKKRSPPKAKSSMVSRPLNPPRPHRSSASPSLALPRTHGRKERQVPSDLESLSSLSASNCSIASSILQRARDRRDKVWNE